MSSTIKSASKGSWRCDARYEVRILLDPWLCPQNFFRHCRRKHRLLMVCVNYIATSQPAIYLSVRLSVRVRPRPSASVRVRESVSLSGPTKVRRRSLYGNNDNNDSDNDTLNRRQIRLQGCSLRVRISRTVWEKKQKKCGCSTWTINRLSTGASSELNIQCLSVRHCENSSLASVAQSYHRRDDRRVSLSPRLSSESALPLSERKSIVEGTYMKRDWILLLKALASMFWVLRWSTSAESCSNRKVWFPFDMQRTICFTLDESIHVRLTTDKSTWFDLPC